MHISRADLNLFVVFETIYTEGGITAASKKLNLSQPAVSHALARLRILFDDPLFSRDGQRMTPTPMARTIIDQVRTSLRGMEITLQKTARFDPTTNSQIFAIAFRDALEPVLMPPIIAEIWRSSPFINVTAVTLERRSLAANLASGELDAGIDVLLPMPPNIHAECIMPEPMVVVVRMDHPRIQGELSLETYLSEGHIQVSSRRRGPAKEDISLWRIGQARNIRLRCHHFETACRAASMTDLIATVPQRYARTANLVLGTQILQPPLSDTALELFLYWHETSHNDPANIWLRQRILCATREKSPDALGV